MPAEQLRFSSDLTQLLSAAMRLAVAEGRSELGVGHVRAALAGDARELEGPPAGSGGMVIFSETLRDAFVGAQKTARAGGRTIVEVGDLVAALPPAG